MRNRQTRRLVITLEFVVLFVFWLILSGRYELKYLVTGLLAAAIVTALTNTFLYSPGRGETGEAADTRLLFVCLLNLLLYAPWLLLAIIKANLQVAYVILHPRMPVDPVLIQFRSRLQRNISLVTLANSITVTPGTLTVDLHRRTYLVHALTPRAAADLESGLMQNRVSRVFCDEEEASPRVLRTRSIKELEE